MNTEQFITMERLVKELYKSGVYFRINESNISTLLNIDIESIVKKFNTGEMPDPDDVDLIYDVDREELLNEEEVSLFCELIIDPKDVLKAIVKAGEILGYKEMFDSIVESKKRNSSFDASERIVVNDLGYKIDLSYGQIIHSLKGIQDFYDNMEVYRFLRYCLKYYSLKEKIERRKRLYECENMYQDKSAKLYSIINGVQRKMGIIRVANSYLGTTEYAGTQAEMEFSNLLGVPYSRDVRYMLIDAKRHTVKKTFISKPSTRSQKEKIIKARLSRLAKRFYHYIDDPGFVLAGDYGIEVSERELLDGGIEPAKVGWEPLELTIEPISYSSLYEKERPDKSIESIVRGITLKIK